MITRQNNHVHVNILCSHTQNMITRQSNYVHVNILCSQMKHIHSPRTHSKQNEHFMSEVFEKFQKWKALVENASGRKLKVLYTDVGGECTSAEFEEFLESAGVRHERTVPKTPEQNGVAERMNLTLVESVRSMLAGASLPHEFWAEALSTAVYLRNRSPMKPVDGMTPFEAWTKKKPSVSHLRVFACAAYAHIPKDERGKLDHKARKCILVGFGEETKGYRLYNPNSPNRRKVFFSRRCVFQ